MRETEVTPPESFLNFNNSTPCWQAETVGLPFPEPLSERYRPAKIGEFIGLEKVRKVLGNFAANPYPSAWLFVGGSGLGKTTMAMALAAKYLRALRSVKKGFSPEMRIRIGKSL